MTGDSATNLVVPHMGVVEEVLIVEWLVSDGATVAEGEPVVLVETNKAETELEAPTAGVLRILTPAGDDEIPVGETIAVVETS